LASGGFGRFRVGSSVFWISWQADFRRRFLLAVSGASRSSLLGINFNHKRLTFRAYQQKIWHGEAVTFKKAPFFLFFVDGCGCAAKALVFG